MRRSVPNTRWRVSNSNRPVLNPSWLAASDSPTAQSLRAWPRATPGTPRRPGTARLSLRSLARPAGKAREAQALPSQSPRPGRPAAAPVDGLPEKHRAELTCLAAVPLHSPQGLNRSSLRPHSAVPQVQGVAETLPPAAPKPDRAVCIAGSPPLTVPALARAYSWDILHAGSCSSREKGAAPYMWTRSFKKGRVL